MAQGSALIEVLVSLCILSCVGLAAGLSTLVAKREESYATQMLVEISLLEAKHEDLSMQASFGAH